MPRKKIPQAILDAVHAAGEFVPTILPESSRAKGEKGLSRIMYIENKSGGLAGGEARIGRVTFSKSRSTIYYQGRAFGSLKGRGYKANYADLETGAEYWISGPKKNGADRLYGERAGVEVDEDVRDEYWTEIPNLPEFKSRECT
jgi:hypothetical protein